MHGYSGATILHVPLSTLFQIIHKLRGSLVGWLESDSRRRVELQHVLNSAYESATGQPADGEAEWAKFREMRNRGRYARLDVESATEAATASKSMARNSMRKTRSEADIIAKTQLVNEENETTVAELNLQVMQVAAAGAVIKPLPPSYKNNPDVTEVLASFGALQAAVEDVRKHVSRYHIVGRGVWLELWDKDEALLQVTLDACAPCQHASQHAHLAVLL